MLRIKYFALVSLSIALSFSACSRSVEPSAGTLPAPAASPVQAPATSTRFVKGSAADVLIHAGGSAEAIVTLAIQSGYHVNANPPTFPYLKATEVVVQAADGVSVSFVTYPNPVTKKFAFAEKPLAVYEGEAKIRVTLKAAAAAAKGPRSLATKLNIQACDDQVCYPPGTLDIAIPATVK